MADMESENEANSETGEDNNKSENFHEYLEKVQQTYEQRLAAESEGKDDEEDEVENEEEVDLAYGDDQLQKSVSDNAISSDDQMDSSKRKLSKEERKALREAKKAEREAKRKERVAHAAERAARRQQVKEVQLNAEEEAELKAKGDDEEVQRNAEDNVAEMKMYEEKPDMEVEGEEAKLRAEKEATKRRPDKEETEVKEEMKEADTKTEMEVAERKSDEKETKAKDEDEDGKAKMEMAEAGKMADVEEIEQLNEEEETETKMQNEVIKPTVKETKSNIEKEETELHLQNKEDKPKKEEEEAGVEMLDADEEPNQEQQNEAVVKTEQHKGAAEPMKEDKKTQILQAQEEKGGATAEQDQEQDRHGDESKLETNEDQTTLNSKDEVRATLKAHKDQVIPELAEEETLDVDIDPFNCIAEKLAVANEPYQDVGRLGLEDDEILVMERRPTRDGEFPVDDVVDDSDKQKLMAATEDDNVVAQNEVAGSQVKMEEMQDSKAGLLADKAEAAEAIDFGPPCVQLQKRPSSNNEAVGSVEVESSDPGRKGQIPETQEGVNDLASRISTLNEERGESIRGSGAAGLDSGPGDKKDGQADERDVTEVEMILKEEDVVESGNYDKEENANLTLEAEAAEASETPEKESLKKKVHKAQDDCSGKQAAEVSASQKEHDQSKEKVAEVASLAKEPSEKEVMDGFGHDALKMEKCLEEKDIGNAILDNAARTKVAEEKTGAEKAAARTVPVRQERLQKEMTETEVAGTGEEDLSAQESNKDKEPADFEEAEIIGTTVDGAVHENKLAEEAPKQDVVSAASVTAATTKQDNPDNDEVAGTNNEATENAENEAAMTAAAIYMQPECMASIKKRMENRSEGDGKQVPTASIPLSKGGNKISEKLKLFERDPGNAQPMAWKEINGKMTLMPVGHVGHAGHATGHTTATAAPGPFKATKAWQRSTETKRDGIAERIGEMTEAQRKLQEMKLKRDNEKSPRISEEIHPEIEPNDKAKDEENPDTKDLPEVVPTDGSKNEQTAIKDVKEDALEIAEKINETEDLRESQEDGLNNTQEKDTAQTAAEAKRQALEDAGIEILPKRTAASRMNLEDAAVEIVSKTTKTTKTMDEESANAKDTPEVVPMDESKNELVAIKDIKENAQEIAQKINEIAYLHPSQLKESWEDALSSNTREKDISQCVVETKQQALEDAGIEIVQKGSSSRASTKNLINSGVEVVSKTTTAMLLSKTALEDAGIEVITNEPSKNMTAIAYSDAEAKTSLQEAPGASSPTETRSPESTTPTEQGCGCMIL